jgi:hypothetical protein
VLQKSFEKAERGSDCLSLRRAELAQLRDQPRLAHFPALEQRLATGRAEGEENLAAIRRMVGPLDPAPVLQGIKRLLHRLRPDLVNIGQRMRRHRTLVVQPDQDAVLGRCGAVLVPERLRPAFDQTDNGPQSCGSAFDFSHIVSNTDDKAHCQILFVLGDVPPACRSA